MSENLKSLIAHFLSPVCSPNTISLSYGSTSWLKGRPTGGTLIFANIWGAGHLSERVCWWVWPDPTAAAAAAAVSAKLIQTYSGRIQGGDDPFCSETFLRLQLRLNVEYLPVTWAHHSLYETGNTKLGALQKTKLRFNSRKGRQPLRFDNQDLDCFLLFSFGEYSSIFISFPWL